MLLNFKNNVTERNLIYKQIRNPLVVTLEMRESEIIQYFCNYCLALGNY